MRRWWSCLAAAGPRGDFETENQEWNPSKRTPRMTSRWLGQASDCYQRADLGVTGLRKEIQTVARNMAKDLGQEKAGCFPKRT